MKHLIISILVFSSFGLFSQKYTKDEKVYKSITGLSIVQSNSYDDGQLISSRMIWIDKNQKYQHITDYMTIYSGSASGMWKHMNDLLESTEKFDDGVKLELNGKNVSIDKVMGVKGASCYDDNYVQWHIYYPSQLKKLMKKYKKWCIKNNVVYEDEESLLIDGMMDRMEEE